MIPESVVRVMGGCAGVRVFSRDVNIENAEIRNYGVLIRCSPKDYEKVVESVKEYPHDGYAAWVENDKVVQLGEDKVYDFIGESLQEVFQGDTWHKLDGDFESLADFFWLYRKWCPDALCRLSEVVNKRFLLGVSKIDLK